MREKVAVKDKQAKEIIAAFSAQYPDGKLPDNMELLPPPVELGVLQQERDAIILEARDRLHAALGDNEFARFDKFVKEKVAPNVRLTGSGELRPKGVR